MCDCNVSVRVSCKLPRPKRTPSFIVHVRIGKQWRTFGPIKARTAIHAYEEVCAGCGYYPEALAFGVDTSAQVQPTHFLGGEELHRTTFSLDAQTRLTKKGRTVSMRYCAG